MDSPLFLIKKMIEADNLLGIQDYYHELQSGEYEEVDWQVLFKDCYLHACLKKRAAIAAWFTSVYEDFDPISKIALRQIFPYGRYLLNKGQGGGQGQGKN